MNTPIVSVVLPIYNGERYLREALDSILAQTLRELELIVVDDQSTDGSRAIAEDYARRDGRIRVLTNAQARGVAGALNTGLDAARGAYVARMDQDDISLPERLAKQVAYLDAHPEVTLCGTWVRLIGQHAGVEWKLATGWDTIRCAMLFYGALAHPSVMFRRADFERNGWRYDPDYAVEDYELWTRIAAAARMVNLPEVLLLYRTHAGNTSQLALSAHRQDGRRIHARQLQRLGLAPSAQEQEAHEVISCWGRLSTPDMARRALAWLDRLLVANRRTRFLPEVAFERFIDQKRGDLRHYMTWRTAGRLGALTLVLKAKEAVVRHLPVTAADELARWARRIWQGASRAAAYLVRGFETLRALAGLGYRLQKTLPPRFKIGLAVLVHERPEYLELCLDSLFKTNLHDYDITFLLCDDGSQDPRVREIVNRPRDPRYKIVRAFTPKGPNSAGAAINKALRLLLELDQFDIIGKCDSDALFHPEWLDQTLKICLWAKQHHRFHVLGPFSSFNSSDYLYHRVLGTYRSPYGNYVVKRQMGMVNYLYFTEDFRKLGFFAENPDNESLMTRRFARLGVRNFCTETSYVEHLGQDSVLNQWRPAFQPRLPHGLNLAPDGWGYDLEQLSPYAYHRYLKKPATFGPDCAPSAWPVDVVMPAIRKDLPVLPYAVDALRRNLRHPLGRIIVVSPRDTGLEDFCRRHGCEFRDEAEVLPLRKKDIHCVVRGRDRSGWLFQQLLKLSADQLAAGEHILLLDADTVLVQPQKFEMAGRSLLLIADEYYWPYYDTYQKLLGAPPVARFSLVAHQMLVSRARLAELRAELECRHQRSWWQAILDVVDPQESSSFSEYETYGHWMLQQHRVEVELEYWFNRALPRRRLGRLPRDLRRTGGEFRSFSYQHYHE